MLPQGSITELLKMVLIVFGIFALLHLLRPSVETLVNFDNLQAYAPAGPANAVVPPSDTFDEGAPVEEVADEDVLEKVIVGEDTLQAEELLPKYDEANEFEKANPISELLRQQSFLQSGYHLGVSTTMQSSKIPYHDLRSLPAVPRNVDWPINNSSLDRSNAFQRRPLNVGE